MNNDALAIMRWSEVRGGLTRNYSGALIGLAKIAPARLDHVKEPRRA